MELRGWKQSRGEVRNVGLGQRAKQMAADIRRLSWFSCCGISRALSPLPPPSPQGPAPSVTIQEQLPNCMSPPLPSYPGEGLYPRDVVGLN